MVLRSQTLTNLCRQKIIHPYEWGILDVKALNFYPIFDCADYSHCSCCCDNFVVALASIAAAIPGYRVIDLSDSSIAHDGAHRIKQAIGYPSRALASAIEEDLAEATDAGLSCIGRCFGDRRLLVEFAQFKQLVSSRATTEKSIKANNF